MKTRATLKGKIDTKEVEMFLILQNCHFSNNFFCNFEDVRGHTCTSGVLRTEFEKFCSNFDSLHLNLAIYICQAWPQVALGPFFHFEKRCINWIKFLFRISTKNDEILMRRYVVKFGEMFGPKWIFLEQTKKSPLLYVIMNTLHAQQTILFLYSFYLLQVSYNN